MLLVGFSIWVYVSAYVTLDYHFSARRKPAIFTSPRFTSPCLNRSVVSSPRFTSSQVIIVHVLQFHVFTSQFFTRILFASLPLY